MRKKPRPPKRYICLALSLLCMGRTGLACTDIQAAQPGWQIIDGARYYFTQQDGKMAAGTFVTWNGVRYYLGQDGRLVTDRRNYVIDGAAYDIDAAGRVSKAGKSLVLLCDDQGSVLKRTFVTTGSEYMLPSIQNSGEATFIGWSLSPGKRFSLTFPNFVDYEVSDTVTVTDNITLYAACFRHTEDKDISQADITRPSEKLGGIIFCGDSRQDYTCFASRHYQDMAGNVYFVAKGGTGLSWFMTDGIPELLSDIIEIRESSEKPIAVVMNFGINDLRSPGINTDEYVPEMTRLAGLLDKLGCSMYFMSVLPGNASQLRKTRGENVRVPDMEAVKNFNEEVRRSLTPQYSYLDLYTWVMTYGYRSDDGLHFSYPTNRRILDECVKRINQSME